MTGHGVVLPAHGESRSSSAFGRDVVVAALGEVDPIGARAAAAETDWRRGYPPHLLRAVEVGLLGPEATGATARAGLAAVHARMRWQPDPQADDRPLAEALAPATPLRTRTVQGRGPAETEFSLPFRGRRLRDDQVVAKLDDWVTRGILEPGVRDGVVDVLHHPEWLRLDGWTVAVLGAGAEMGPLRALLRWGADVAAVDLPRPQPWADLTALAHGGAGRLFLPVGPDDRPGADLLHDLGSVAAWIGTLPGRPVLGNYVYADGITNLRLSAATDLLATGLLTDRPDAALAYLATPTDAFVVPAEAVAHSNAAYGRPGGWSRVRGPLRAASGGRLLRRQYAPGDAPGVNDSIVPQQGPNYLLAKRIHRWRAAAAAADGRVVSMNIAPPTRTRSVLKNRALAAAYAGAHRFGVEVFDPATSNTLMAALLVRDLQTAGSVAAQGGWRAEATQAAHGGLWRTAYDPRSALGIAAVLGVGALRG